MAPLGRDYFLEVAGLLAAGFFVAAFRLRVWARALPAADRPAGLVAFFANARPAALATLGLVVAFRPVWESALPAADFAEGDVLLLRSAWDAWDAASSLVLRLLLRVGGLIAGLAPARPWCRTPGGRSRGRRSTASRGSPIRPRRF